MNFLLNKTRILALILCISASICTAVTTPLAAEEASTRTSVIEGKIVKVVPSKKEIYVSNEQGKHEFYFNPSTQLRHGTDVQEFSALQVGQQVKVTANIIGKRLDPLEVEIVK